MTTFLRMAAAAVALWLSVSPAHAADDWWVLDTRMVTCVRAAETILVSPLHVYEVASKFEAVKITDLKSGGAAGSGGVLVSFGDKYALFLRDQRSCIALKAKMIADGFLPTH